MIEFIVALEDMLTASGVDWGIRYDPDNKVYVLKYNDVNIAMFKMEE